MQGFAGVQLGKTLMAVTISIGIAMATGSVLAGSVTDPFRIDALFADVVADDAVTAKEQAIAQVKRAALDRLYRRLAKRAQHQRLPKVSLAHAEKLMASFSFVDVEQSPIRFKLEAVVRFDPGRTVAHFRRYGTEAFAVPGPKVIVIPMLREGDILLAFDKADPWNAAINQQRRQYPGLVPIKLIDGAGVDIHADGPLLLKGDRLTADAIRMRYDGQGVVVALAEKQASGKITLTIGGNNGSSPLSAVRTGMDWDDAALQLSIFLEEAWKHSVARGAALLHARIRYGHEPSMTMQPNVSILPPFGGSIDDITVASPSGNPLPEGVSITGGLDQ